MTECTGKEKVVEKVPDTTSEPEIEPEPEKKSSGGAVALLLLLLVQGVQQILRIRPLFSGGHFPHLKSHHANSSEFSQQQYYSRKQLSVV